MKMHRNKERDNPISNNCRKARQKLARKFSIDATMVKPSKRKITGKRSDTETVMLRLEGVVGKVPVMVADYRPHIKHGFEAKHGG